MWQDDDEDEDDEESPLGGGPSPPGDLASRSSTFSFAMVHNGTIMTQMVVSLLAQQVSSLTSPSHTWQPPGCIVEVATACLLSVDMCRHSRAGWWVQVIRDFLGRSWPYLSEENLVRMIDALRESVDYAAEFNSKLGLRDKLRMCGLMQQHQDSQQAQGGDQVGAGVAAVLPPRGAGGRPPALAPLPHLQVRFAPAPQTKLEGASHKNCKFTLSAPLCSVRFE